MPLTIAKRKREFIAAFRRNARGSLVRDYERCTMTVYRRKDGRFGWSSDRLDDGPMFSDQSWATEEEALQNLAAGVFNQ